MNLPKSLIGAIFQIHNGNYYLGLGLGHAVIKQEAYIYTIAEARSLVEDVEGGWGNKSEGKWILVYE